jgi:hypothetical protein
MNYRILLYKIGCSILVAFFTLVIVFILNTGDCAPGIEDCGETPRIISFILMMAGVMTILGIFLWMPRKG